MNGRSSQKISIEPAEPGKPFDSYTQAYLSFPHTHIPAPFWDAAAALLQAELRGGSHLLNTKEKMFSMTHKRSDGTRRTAICSANVGYAKPDFRFGEPVPSRLERVSEFPCHPLAVTEGKLACKGGSGVYGQLHIPPFGLFVFDGAGFPSAAFPL